MDLRIITRDQRLVINNLGLWRDTKKGTTEDERRIEFIGRLVLICLLLSTLAMIVFLLRDIFLPVSFIYTQENTIPPHGATFREFL